MLVQPTESSSPISTIKAITSKPRRLYRTTIYFDNWTTHALVDSGAAGSVISTRLFAKINPEGIVESRSDRDLSEFTTASGEPLTTFGCYEIPFKLKKMRLRQAFHIMGNIEEACILGTDFLEDFKANINMETRLITTMRIKKKM